MAENWTQTEMGLWNIARPALFDPLPILLQLEPWLLQKRCAFSRRDLANPVLSKMQVY